MDKHTQVHDPKELLQQNRLLSEEIQRRVSQLAAINTVAASVSQSLDLEDTLQTALDAVLSIITVEAAGISLVDESAGKLILRAQRGLDLDFVSQPMSIKLGEGLSGRVVADDIVIVTGDIAQEARLAVPSFIKEKIKAQALAPMHARGRVIGVLSVMSHSEYAFSQAEIDVLKAIADQVGVALDNAQLYEEARQQQERLSTVIYSAADAIIATDADGHISLINDAAKFMFDVQAEKVIGMPLAEAPLESRLRSQLHHAMRNMSESASMFDVTMDSGRTLTAVVSRLRSNNPLDTGGDRDGWVVVMRDITRLKQAEEARMEFVQTAAHDLRNPLGVTMSALVMLQDYMQQQDPATMEIFQIATEAVNRMQTLLQDLLHLEQLQTTRNLDVVRMDIAPLLQSTVYDMSPALASRQQQVRVDIAAPLPPVDVSVEWLQRAITNYLSNAAKYTDEGSKIILHAREQNQELLIEVRDEGPGIPLAEQARLFERFYRVPSRNDDVIGSGLGLAIVKSIAKSHGGRVYVQSEPGQGSVFGIALPIPQD
jgi:PAS domain S-box-containing protein